MYNGFLLKKNKQTNEQTKKLSFFYINVHT